MSWVLSSRDTGEKNTVSFSSTRCQERLLSKTLKSRSEVAAATLELIKKEQRRTQASLVYLRKDGAKDYKTKVLQDFLRQEGISHEVTERYCPQSNGLAERLKLTIMDKVCCMRIDANLTPKLWPYAAHCAVLIYNNLTHSALDKHKRPNDAYGDSSDFSKLYVFGTICYALQSLKLLHNLEERSAKGLFLGIDPAGYKVLNLKQSFLCSKNCEDLRWQFCLYRRKLNSRTLPRRGTNTLKFFGSYAWKT